MFDPPRQESFLRSIVKYQTSIDTDPQSRALDEPDLATALAMATGAPHGNRLAGFESLGRSAASHLVLVAAAALLGLAAGAGAGYVHPPTYTAEEQLIVGRTSGLAENEIPGLAVAVDDLASNYARLISNSDVISDTESTLHVSSLPGTLIATPVPSSSVIDVMASAPTKAQALSLANAGGAALVSVVTQVTNDGQAQLAPIIASYQHEDSVVEKATAEANVYQSELNIVVTKVGVNAPSAAERSQEQSLTAQISKWQTAADLARLQANAEMNNYNSAVPPLQTQQEMVQAVGAAVYSSSNKTSFIEAGGLAGLVGGLIVGIAGAALIDTRRGRASGAARAR
jgi:capsular polysaccharide biosynthesis protein